MSDIFISYSRSNQKWVRKIAIALEESGYDVWWDTELLAGDYFHHVIPAELEKAKCVLVVWSKVSITRKWVRAEATRGDDRGILVPILMEAGVELPMPFNMLQAEDMARWNGNSNHALFKHLLLAVNQHCKPQAVLNKKKTPFEKYTAILFLFVVLFMVTVAYVSFDKRVEKVFQPHRVINGPVKADTPQDDFTISYMESMQLLDKIASGNITLSKEEKTKIFNKIYVLASADRLTQTSAHYDPSSLCAREGLHMHVVAFGESLAKISDMCGYSLNYSYFSAAKKHNMSVNDILVMAFNDKKIITKITLIRKQTKEASIIYSVENE